jgi:MFS family permease
MYSPNYYLLLIGRTMFGIIIGINVSLIPVYVREFSPVEISGKTGSFHSLFNRVGIFLSFLVGISLPNYQQIKERNGYDD